MGTPQDSRSATRAESNSRVVQREIASRLRAIAPGRNLLIELMMGLVVAGAVTGLRWQLDPWLEYRVPYVFPIAAVSIASRLGTWRGGLTCGVTSFLLANYLFVAPRLQFHTSTDDLVTAAAVALLMGVMLVLSHRAQRAARVVDELACRLAEADEQKSHLLAVLAHELRNPLSAATNASRLLQLASTDERSRQAADVICRQLGQMGRLVQDLGDASVIHEGKITLNRKPVALESVVAMAVEAVNVALAARGQMVKVQVPVGIVVDVDVTRMVQVFSNLLHNACKFSPPNSTMVVCARVDERAVSVQVKDSGVGIARERLEWIFDSYAQLSPGGGGLGLGLSLVRKLVEMHGGEVRAVSAGPGEGTTFEVMLPRRLSAGLPLHDQSLGTSAV